MSMFGIAFVSPATSSSSKASMSMFGITFVSPAVSVSSKASISKFGISFVSGDFSILSVFSKSIGSNVISVISLSIFGIEDVCFSN